MSEAIDVARTADDPPWDDTETRRHLEVLVEGVATLAGFDQSAILLRRDSGFEVVAAVNVKDCFVGSLTPTEVVEAEIARATDWGGWCFVSHELIGETTLEHSHVPDIVPLDGQDAWHPEDALFAPLYDDSGALRGLLGVDCPRDGRLPSRQTLEVLTGYAGLARTLVLLALERAELSQQVRLAARARKIVREALAEPTLEQVLAACRSTVVSCFDALGMWLTAFDHDGRSPMTIFTRGATVDPPFSEIDDLVLGLARRYWNAQYVAPFSREAPAQPGLTPAESDLLLAFLDRLGVGSALFVPLGVGRECVGFLVLTREEGARPWSTIEIDAARDIGRDLGRAVANARQLELERSMVEQLREMDHYRVQVVKTLGHELRNPLFAISANLELIDSAALDEDGIRAVEATRRGASRMQAVVDDMLTMAQVADPHHEFVPSRLDIGAIAREVHAECAAVAAAGEVTVEVSLPQVPVYVLGERDGLNRALVNLVSNAIKYTDPGGSVLVTVRVEEPNALVSVTDTGIGISSEDQSRLFDEFFRSTNPDALSRPGTGLGLAIVARVADRHCGSIDISSEPGEGTTATLTLPIHDPANHADPAETHATDAPASADPAETHAPVTPA